MLDLKYLRARLKQIDTLLECANSVGCRFDDQFLLGVTYDEWKFNLLLREPLDPLGMFEARLRAGAERVLSAVRETLTSDLLDPLSSLLTIYAPGNELTQQVTRESIISRVDATLQLLADHVDGVLHEAQVGIESEDQDWTMRDDVLTSVIQRANSR